MKATTPSSQNDEDALVSVYVWERPVRITHWLIAIAILVLSVTGFYIGHPFIVAPGPAGQQFVMGWVKAIHFFAAIVFTLSELSRIAWMFVGNVYARWHQFIPLRKHRWKGLWEWIRFYLFLRREPPKFVGHNPLAGLTYLSVYILCLTAAGTGYALFAMSVGPESPMRIFSGLLPLFGGAQPARWIHHVVVWLILAVVVPHGGGAVLVARVGRNAALGSIISGYRFVKRDHLAAEEAENGA